MELLDKDCVVCWDESVVAWLDEGVVKFLDKSSKDDFDVGFVLPRPLEYILEKTLGGKFILHHGYIYIIGWSETYVHFCHDYNYETPMICQYNLNNGRDKG